MTQIFAVMAVFGMACLVWLAWGWLLLPGRCPIRAQVLADGGGEGLEQTLRALRWLRRSGLLRCEVVIRDNGLDRAGLELALTLARREGARFLGRRPDAGAGRRGTQ